MAWFRNPSSIRPPKRVRCAPVGRDPSDDDDDNDDDDDDDDGSGRGRDQGEDRPEGRPHEGQRDDDGAGPSHGYVGGDPINSMGWDLYRDKWTQLDTLQTNYENVSREQKKQREEIDRLSKEMAQIKMSGRHSFSGGGCEPSVLCAQTDGQCAILVVVFLAAPYTGIDASSSGVPTRPPQDATWAPIVDQAVHIRRSPVVPGRLSYGEQKIQHVEPEVQHLKPEIQHVSPEVRQFIPDVRMSIPEKDKGKVKKTPRPVREKRPAKYTFRGPP